MDQSSIPPESGGSASDELLTLASATGRSFLDHFVTIIAECFEADLATIGTLRALQQDEIRVVAGLFDGKRIDGMIYEACVTPCLEVVQNRETVAYLQDVHLAFPQDQMFVDEQIRSYFGMPIRDADGHVIGLVQLAWRRSIDPEEVQQYSETIEMFLVRLGAEVSALNTMQMHTLLAQVPKNIGSRAALELLTQQIQKAFQVHAVMVAVCETPQHPSFCILSYCQNGQLVEELVNTSQTFEGSPCAELKSKDQFLVPDGLADRYPWHEGYRANNLESYLGFRIEDDEGLIIGHFALLNQREITLRKMETELFERFQERASLELRRFRSEQENMVLKEKIQTAI